MLVAGCGSAGSRGAAGSASGAGVHSERITKASFDGTWPFTVDDGELRCEGSGVGAVVFTSSGSDYGVNGTALDQGYRSIKPIWKKASGAFNGPRVNVGDVLDAGLKLC